MNRVNVYEVDECGDRSLVGWFDSHAATSYREKTRWDGNNQISVVTGSQWDHHTLWLTAGGRWVLHAWSQWQGSTPSYRFMSPRMAELWLIENGHDDVVEKLFGPIEAEACWVPVSVDNWARFSEVRAYAARRGINVGDAIRELVNAGLSHERVEI